MISIKKYYYALTTLLLMGMFVSCDLGDNINPDASTNTTMEEALPVVLFYGAQLNYDHAEYGSYLTQTITTGGRNPAGSLGYKSGWEFLLMNRHPQWRRHFYDLGMTSKAMRELAEVEGSQNYILIGRTLELMSLLYTTDVFGAMPRSDAYNSVAPKYDSQEEIYDYMYSEIDNLLKDYNDDSKVNSPQNKRISIKQDRIYAGDLEKWKRFTYALKARMHLRKLPNWKNTPVSCEIIINAVDSALIGWEEPLYKFDGGSGEQNCPWGPAQPVINSWESRKNELDKAIPAKYFAEQILGMHRSSSIEQDPRALFLMKPRTGPASDPVEAFRYLDANFGMEASYEEKNFPDLFSRVDGKPTVLTSNNSYVPYMLTEELLLIKAEAQYWNNEKAEAYKTTLDAATINMDRHGIGSSSKRYYFRSALFMPEAGFNIGHLMRQKYVCMYLQAEQWNDMRRYKYSNSVNKIIYDGVEIYPELRRPYNLYNAYWGGNQDWVQRLNYDPETEEKYNRQQLIELGAFENPNWLKKSMIWAE